LAITCPPLPRILELLENKRRLAIEAYKYDQERRRFVFDVSPIVAEASRMFGKLQLVDESIEPDETAYRSILYTLPGLYACMHMEFKRRGILKNEVFALEGAGGSGKSTIAYWLVRWLGGLMITPTDDVVKVFRDILKERLWFPIIVLDDIASVVSKYWIFDRGERAKWMAFFRALEYVRDVTGVLLMTARSFSGIAKKLREMATLVGVVKRIVVADMYIIDVIIWRKSDMPRSSRPDFIDVVWPGIKIPEEEFEEQLEKRRKMALSILESIGGRRKKGGSGEEDGEEEDVEVDLVEGGEDEAG